MTQADVIDWVKAHGCTITHQKDTFYRVVNAEGKAMGIPEPRQGHENVQPMTVCRICHELKIPIPDYAKRAYEMYAEIQKNHHGREL